jgi:hypothetical protein
MSAPAILAAHDGRRRRSGYAEADPDGRRVKLHAGPHSEEPVAMRKAGTPRRR